MPHYEVTKAVSHLISVVIEAESPDHAYAIAYQVPDNLWTRRPNSEWVDRKPDDAVEVCRPTSESVQAQILILKPAQE